MFYEWLQLSNCNIILSGSMPTHTQHMIHSYNTESPHLKFHTFFSVAIHIWGGGGMQHMCVHVCVRVCGGVGKVATPGWTIPGMSFMVACFQLLFQ